MTGITKYFWNLLLALDQFANTLGAGDPDETISSRAAKAQRQGKRWGCVLCQWLHKIDPNHCEKSIEHDEGADQPTGVPGWFSVLVAAFIAYGIFLALRSLVLTAWDLLELLLTAI